MIGAFTMGLCALVVWFVPMATEPLEDRPYRKATALAAGALAIWMVLS